MQFTVEIPDAEATRIASAICASVGYAPTSMQDAVEKTKVVVFEFLARTVIDQEAAAAATAASDAVRTNATDPLALALFTPPVLDTAQPSTTKDDL